MAYTDRFDDVDDLISNLSPIISGLPTETQSKFVGFLAVNAVTAYELAIREIIEDYATSKHCDFGEYVRCAFSRINGRISIGDIKGELKKFGGSYRDNFETNLNAKESLILTTTGNSLSTCYDNLLTCRHRYVHASVITLTIQECINNYRIGKNVIEALYNTMQ